MNPVELNLFSSRLEAICEQMGEVLRNAAFSPNIRDRLDFSCALFDATGMLLSQAAHIPVHLGSMAFAMASIVNKFNWQKGDQVILNDPFLGGTHLPDVTLIAPVFSGKELAGFVVNRAHHANIGSETPGSMPVSASLHEEGMIIEPRLIIEAGQPDKAFLKEIAGKLNCQVDDLGDFSAQISANHYGVDGLLTLIAKQGLDNFLKGVVELNSYAERLAYASLIKIPDGQYCFEDFMDDDGQNNRQILIRLMLTIDKGRVMADFDGSAAQVAGNINCPLSVTVAGVYYALRCLMPDYTPACDGAFRLIKVSAPAGSLLNARYPAAVAAGNVETSTRVVDVTLGALAQAIPESIPAASHGSMNNVAMGNRSSTGSWHYYETIGGGMGAGAKGNGLSAVQTHMTNTLNTPIEVVETHYPLRILEYSIRRGSGGKGKQRGGDGIVRKFQMLEGAHVSLLTERRHFSPWGMNNGAAGAVGVNLINSRPVQSKLQTFLQPGDVLTLKTPGGGGYG